MSISSQGTTFTFSTTLGNFSARVTRISVEEAQPELVDMTSVGDAIGTRRVIPTGDITSPTKIQIEYMRGTADLVLFPVGSLGEQFVPANGPYGTLSIQHQNFSVVVPASVESASTELASGDVIRGRLSFVVNNNP